MMQIDLTNEQIDLIVKQQLEAYLAVETDERIKMSLLNVIENYFTDEVDDVLQGAVATTAC
ncbi:MAG: hypothetical protein VW270_27570 [Candidatus Poseidoniales archaeon]|jgi:hypothetical protein